MILRIVRYADSDRAKAVRQIQKSDEANSLGSKKELDRRELEIQRAAQD
jgi:hypothetical protein